MKRPPNKLFDHAYNNDNNNNDDDVVGKITYAVNKQEKRVACTVNIGRSCREGTLLTLSERTIATKGRQQVPHGEVKADGDEGGGEGGRRGRREQEGWGTRVRYIKTHTHNKAR